DRVRGKDLPIGFVSRFHYAAQGAGEVVERLVALLRERPGVALREGARAIRVARCGEGWSVATADGLAALARSLRFRHMVLVMLVVDAPRVSDANWLYVPDPGVRVCRVSEFK